MKKFLLAGICFASAMGNLYSAKKTEKTQPTPSVQYNREDNHRLIEYKMGYFMPWYNTMREIYNDGGLDLQFCYSEPVWKDLSAYVDIGYVRMTGHSLGFNQFTRFEMMPISLGLNGFYPLHKMVKAYATIGPRYFFVFQTNYSNYVPSHMNENGIGGFLIGGLLIEKSPHLVFDLFVDTSYCELSFKTNQTNVQTRKMQVGGAIFGMGVAYSF